MGDLLKSRLLEIGIAPLLFSIPREAWVSGKNTLFVRLAGYPFEIKLSPIQLGPLPLLQHSYALRSLIQFRLIAVLFPVTLTIAAFIVGLYLRRRKESLYLWFGLSVLGWASYSLNFFVRDIFISVQAWETVAFSSILWWSYFQAVFVLRFLKIKRPRLEKLFTLHVVTGSLFLCFTPVDQMINISKIWFAGSLLIAAYFIILTVRLWLRQKKKEIGVLAIFLILIWLTCLHDLLLQSRYFSYVGIDVFFLNLYASPFIFLFAY